MMSNTQNSDNVFFDSVKQNIPFTEEGMRRRFKYRVTNSNLTILKNYFGDTAGRNIIAVSGSAIQLFSLLENLNPPNMIYGFDYSPKQVAYNYFLKSAVELLSFKEFAELMRYSPRATRRRAELKTLRRKVVQQMPKNIRRFMPRNHEFTKRDSMLTKVIGGWFFESERKYALVKRNINHIRFFVLNLGRQQFTRIFNHDVFDIVYLSNVLDWICWHRRMSIKNFRQIIDDIGNVSKKEASLIFYHLTNRPTVISRFLRGVEFDKEMAYTLYTYRWHIYRITINKLLWHLKKFNG